MGTRQLAQYEAKLSSGGGGSGLTEPFQFAGAPTSGAAGTFVGRAVIGSLLIDTTNGLLYQATSATTATTVTWGKVGPQV
jgi:hypothetical protein